MDNLRNVSNGYHLLLENKLVCKSLAIYFVNQLLLIVMNIEPCRIYQSGMEKYDIENNSMTVWILAGNGINLSIAAGLIRLHVHFLEWKCLNFD